MKERPSKPYWHQLDSPWTLATAPRAVRLWMNGNDTYDIARALDMKESDVYSLLPLWRATFGESVRAGKKIA